MKLSALVLLGSLCTAHTGYAQSALEVVPAPIDSGEETRAPGALANLQVLVLDIRPGPLAGDTVAAATDLVTTIVGSYPALDVLSGTEFKRAMEIQAQRLAVGCSEDDCIAELAGALGADLVIFGRGAKLGEVRLINLSLFDAVRSKTVGRSTIKFEEPDELLKAIKPAVAQLINPHFRRRGVEIPEAMAMAEIGEEPSSWPGWTLISLGLPTAIAGGLGALSMTLVGYSLWLLAQSVLWASTDRYLKANTQAERDDVVTNVRVTYDNYAVLMVWWNLIGLIPVMIGLGGLTMVASGTYWLASGDDGDE